MTSTSSSQVAVADYCRDGSRKAADYCRDGSRKAAISLNNAAVSLLSKGFSREAAATFEDAIKFIVFLDNKVSITSVDGIVLDKQIQESLALSSRRTADCSKFVSHENTANWPTLHVISSQCNPVRVYEILTACTDTASLHVSFPMTIDPIDSDSYNDDDVSFEAGVILYNYGVAHDCVIASSVVHTLNDAYVRDLIQTEAHRIYLWANSIIHKVDSEPCIHCNSDRCCITSRLLLLRTALFHNLIHASIHLNLQAEYNAYCSCMANLLHTVERQQAVFPIADDLIAAAA